MDKNNLLHEIYTIFSEIYLITEEAEKITFFDLTSKFSLENILLNINLNVDFYNKNNQNFIPNFQIINKIIQILYKLDFISLINEKYVIKENILKIIASVDVNHVIFSILYNLSNKFL